MSNITAATSREGEIYPKTYKGIRQRKWGKWVSEIRVPGSQQRLWLGSYATPEAAAMAHDVAIYCLRGTSSPEKLNFPSMLPATARTGLSPRSVQNVASDAGMAMDAQLSSKDEDTNGVVANGNEDDRNLMECEYWEMSLEGSDQLIRQGEDLSISVDDYF